MKWSAGLHSSPTNRVRIWPKHTVFSVKFVFEMNEKKQKEAGIGQLKKCFNCDKPAAILFIFVR